MARSSGVSSDLAFLWDTPAGQEDWEDVFFEVDYGELGVDPRSPTTAKPGSPEKVATLAARYAAGLPLWHNADCYDHGPKMQHELV